MTLRIDAIKPENGPTWGGAVVEIRGQGFGATPRVLFDGVPAIVQVAEPECCYVLAPRHDAGWVHVEMMADGQRHRAVDRYCYTRGALAGESDLTRLVRTLLRNLKAHILEQTSMTVDVAYGSPGSDGMPAVALATLPALVVSGPSLEENRTLSTNVGYEGTDDAGRVVLYPPPYTVNLVFSLVGGAAQKVELINLLNATVNFVHNVGKLTMLRDLEFPRLGDISWPLEFTRLPHTHDDDGTGIKSFTCELRVKGFDMGGSYPNRLVPVAEAAHVAIGAQGGKRD